MVTAHLIKDATMGHALILIAVTTAQCLQYVLKRTTCDSVYAKETVRLKKKTLKDQDLNVVGNL